MISPYSSFQVSDPKFAAACVALGMGCTYDAMEHVPSGPGDSQKRQTLYKTFHLTPSEEYFPKELYNKLSTGKLAIENPAHPLFPALAAIESLEMLRAQHPQELSLVPLLPAAFLSGLQRACILQLPRPNDGNLNPHFTAVTAPTRYAPMDRHFAAVAAVAGFPFLSTEPNYGRTNVIVGPSLAFPGLDLQALCQFFIDFESQGATPDLAGRVPVAHSFPGAPPGEHAIHYAYAAVRVYQGYTSRAAQKATRLLLTSTFSALVSSKMDKKEEDLAVRFIVEGGSVLA